MTTLPPLRARAEHFGAWARLDDRTMVALDRETARSLGILGDEVWDGPQPLDTTGALSAPLEVHVAITTRCPVQCTGCYQEARPEGVHVETTTLLESLDALAAAGVFTVAFGGGEPLTHPALERLAEHARARGLTPVLTTSGIGLSEERARSLAAYAQINVSHDGVGEAYEAVRGFDGGHVAERAIRTLVAAGIPVGVNVVLTRDSYGAEGAHLLATVAHVASLGAREIQLLRYKPAGRAASLDYLARRLAPVDVDALPRVLAALVARGDVSIRIDCALVPLLSPAFAALDAAEATRRLTSLGVFGCEAGNALSAVKPSGLVAPCSFLGEGELPVRDLATGFGDDATLARARGHVDRPSPPCDTCNIRRVCRGGCRVVADHLRPLGGPDPECPRVRAFEEAR